MLLKVFNLHIHISPSLLQTYLAEVFKFVNLFPFSYRSDTADAVGYEHLFLALAVIFH